MMSTYLVWDPLNSSEEHGLKFETWCYTEAAEEYAAVDCDGLSDGLYTYRGGPLNKISTQGHLVHVKNLQTDEVRKVRVGVIEYAPVWDSTEVTDG